MKLRISVAFLFSGKSRTSYLAALLAGALTLAGAGEVAAATFQDFDSAGDPYLLSRHNLLPAAAILGGGPTGAFLRLANSGSANQLNSIAFDRTDKGAFCTVTIDVDFRMTPSATPGDGLGLVFLDTARHEEFGGVSFPAEEPNLADSVGVGLDIFANPGEINDNHVSLHFDGVELLEVDATPILDLDATAGAFAHIRIIIDATPASGSVRVDLTAPGGSATTLIDQTVSGLQPYEGRLAVAARTSASTADHDIDNVSVTYAGCPSELGSWGSVIPWPIVAIHAGLMPTGDILFWDRDDAIVAPPQLFDPVTEIVTPTPDPGLDLFCSGHSLLSDGRLFVSGGHDGFDAFGIPDAHIYDPELNTWHHIAQPMNAGRWYPTNLTLPNGEVLVISGSISPGVINPLPQVFDPETETWRDLTGASKSVPLYPMMLQAPDGRAAMVGPAVKTELLDVSGVGGWSLIGNRVGPIRNQGTATAYDHGKILVIGGGDPPVSTAERLDLGVPSPAWSVVAAMAYKRRHLTSLLLADGTVLVTGGTQVSGFNDATGAVFTPELWDPQTEAFTRLAGHQIPRLYHSFSLLLPDARVLVGGGGHPPSLVPDFDHLDAEIYSPAYLFKGLRPTITSAPSIITYGAPLFVGTPDRASIAAVHFIGLSETTHSFNQNQRIHRATFQLAAGGLLVDAPPTNIHAQPGHYMLFLIDDKGVPSVSEFVQLIEPSSVPALPTAAFWLLAVALAITAGLWLRRMR